MSTLEPNTYRIGHVLDVLRDLPSRSVQCCITSPPYWGLRDYGDEGQQWPEVRYKPMPGMDSVLVPERTDALGLEPSPKFYVGHIVAVFREVMRVLRDDGTLWLNLGDSYNGVGRGTKANGMQVAARATTQRTYSDAKPKDLCGIPWRVAFALQADGWYLRSDIIWAKPNPMPESVTDRPTKAHEYLFLLSKNQRYYYDADAIKEPAGFDPRQLRQRGDLPTERNRGGRTDGLTKCPGGYGGDSGRNKRSVWTVPTSPYSGAHFACWPPSLIKPAILAGCPEGGIVLDPFLGSGTTAMVAESLGRKWFGCDVVDKHEDLIRERTAQQGLL